ncbi:MAG: integrase core domain-containing protein [Fimbriimonadaceae bacterium]|nr:integrase core domain-containing protein [Alphaproteobacteria bacterium]
MDLNDKYVAEDGDVYVTGTRAQIVINTWLKQYNHVRPHQTLNMRPPVPETLSRSGL